MKTFISLILLTLLFLSCEKETTAINGSVNQISFSTDKFSYTSLDTIYLSLDNKKDLGIIIALRCGVYLEMSYQRKENGHWSEDLWFWYMWLRCPTMLDTVEANSTFNHSLPADIFESTGTFRLLLGCSSTTNDSGEVVISNSFDIE